MIKRFLKWNAEFLLMYVPHFAQVYTANGIT